MIFSARSVRHAVLPVAMGLGFLLFACSNERATGPSDAPPALPAPLITESPIAAISDTLHGTTPKGGPYPYEYTFRIPPDVLAEFGPIDDILIHFASDRISVFDNTRSEWIALQWECCTWLLSQNGIAVPDALDPDNGIIRLSISILSPPSIQLLRYQDDYQPVLLGPAHTPYYGASYDPRTVREARALDIIDGRLWVAIRNSTKYVAPWFPPYYWRFADSLYAFNVTGESAPVTFPDVTPAHAMTQFQSHVWTLTEPYPTIVNTDVFGRPNGSFVIERENPGADWEIQIAPSTLYGDDDRLWIMEWSDGGEWSARLLGIDTEASLSSGLAVIDREFLIPSEIERPLAVVRGKACYYIHSYNPDEDASEILKMDDAGRVLGSFRPGVGSVGPMAWDGEAVWLVHTLPLPTQNPTLRLSRFYIP